MRGRRLEQAEILRMPMASVIINAAPPSMA